MNDISVIILTYNEEKHIGRCIRSLQAVTHNIFVVDSYSTDNTVAICESLGAIVCQRAWINYADQFQWGLEHCPFTSEWMMRMDADEYIEPDLARELASKLPAISQNVTGLYIKRKYYFIGQWIKNGNVYPLNLLRVWRRGKGRIESRWMDEHIVIDSGETQQLQGHIVDDNLNTTHWWIAKHNSYADREMIDILDQKYHFFAPDHGLITSGNDSQAKFIRKVKQGIYNKLPLFLRPTLYFFYRYFIRLGFLDGLRGFAYHFIQGYWYRTLVDLRVLEANKVLEGAATNDERLTRLEQLTGLKLK
ncbi:glycosyltransferase family 2 protein [Photobacterium atrarenae]|uniref:Glycosyltransferase family 2 protein n=1 Tax=Photobacterium atrarenae TaxID=865757 RepID=A0ABY5GMX5_9GAMM|nr:glycosyltransferase family 2 protein [Photobacterium atrarenae]UTV30464.1 glycosyltransferase family 2 protein [Photobacterium atrarenae]